MFSYFAQILVPSTILLTNSNLWKILHTVFHENFTHFFDDFLKFELNFKCQGINDAFKWLSFYIISEMFGRTLGYILRKHGCSTRLKKSNACKSQLREHLVLEWNESYILRRRALNFSNV